MAPESAQMSRRSFGRSVALATPVVIAGGVLDRHNPGALFGATNAGDGTSGAVLAGSTTGVHGTGGQFGVLGTTEGEGGYGVYGYAAGSGSAAVGGGSRDADSFGAHLGVSGPRSVAVHGESAESGSTGLRGVARGDNSSGVHGVALGPESAGVLADASTAIDSTHALWAEGRSHVNGPLSHSSAGFKIDHPVRPATHYLAHSVVESSEMKTVYDGLVTIGSGGTAEVHLPDWFSALNGEYRYQLTPIGSAAPELHVASELHGNRFVIGGGRPGLRVSWMITGVRRDPAAAAEPVQVEQAKAPQHVGGYLRPELHAGGRALRPRGSELS